MVCVQLSMLELSMQGNPFEEASLKRLRHHGWWPLHSHLPLRGKSFCDVRRDAWKMFRTSWKISRFWSCVVYLHKSSDWKRLWFVSETRQSWLYCVPWLQNHMRKCDTKDGTKKPRKKTRIPTTFLPFFTRVANIMCVCELRASLNVHCWALGITWSHIFWPSFTCNLWLCNWCKMADKRLCQIWAVQKTRLLASIVATPPKSTLLEGAPNQTNRCNFIETILRRFGFS